MEQNQNPYQNQQQYQQYQQPYQQQYQPPGGGQYGGASGLAMTTSPVEFIRAQAISPVYLVATIALTLQILFEIIASSGGILSSALNAMSNLYYYTGYYDSTMEELLDLFGGGGISSWAIISNAPNILIAVGLWLLFASASSQANPPIKTIGLKIINVIVIIRIVICCIWLAIGEIVLLMLAKEVGSDGASYIILAMLVFAAFYIIQILFYLKVKQTIKTGQIMAEYDQLDQPIAMYVPVCCFIFGGFAVFGMILGSAMAAICSATAYITFGVLLLSIRKKTEQLRYGQAVEISAKAKINGYQPQRPDTRWEEEQRRRQEEEQRRQQEEQRRRQEEEQRRQQEEEERRRQQGQQPVPNPVDPNRGTVVLRENQRTTPGTVVLTDEETDALPPAKLVRQKDQTVVAIGKRQFRIGSDRSNVDYWISDNRSISRHHADILYQNGAFHIIDQNSTNHVALNGQRINSSQPYALQDGMQIRLSNEDFLWQQG